MKKISFALATVLLSVIFSATTATAQPAAKASKPSATFHKMWVEYDVKEGEKYGMRIHAKFTTYKMLNMPSYMAIYFQKSDGTKLLTNNLAYRSKSGQVAVFKALEIGYEPGVFSDLKLFLPYSELSLSPGKYDLTMSVDLIYK